MKKIEKLCINNFETVPCNPDETYKAACYIFSALEKKDFLAIDVLSALCFCSADFAIICDIDKQQFIKKMDGLWDELVKVRINEQ